MPNQKPVLTISLLISNRPDTVPRCLDSLKPIMAAIPSELILIDTSKSEEIRQLLLTYTDQVYSFEWCQDFAKARNEGLRRAKGEWFMFLDDDEWFVQYDELIDFFVSKDYKRYGFANYIVRSFIDVEYKKYQDGWVSRLFRIENNTKFVGKVHELHQPISGEQKYLDVIANHSGYVFDSEEKIRAHYERNSEILLKVLEEDPLNLRWQAQMVQEYRTVKKWDSIVEFCKKSLTECKEIKTDMERNHLGTLYIGLVEGLMRAEEHEESIEIAKHILKEKRTTEMCKAFATFYIAQNYVALDNWKAAQKYAKNYLEWHTELTKNPQLIKEQSNSLLVKDVFEYGYIRKANNILAYADLMKEDIQAFSKRYEKLAWQAEELKVYDKLVELVIEKMGTMDYHPIFSRAITDAYKNDVFRKFICNKAQEIERDDETAYRNIAYVFSRADADDWFIWYNRIIVADANVNKDELEQAFAGLFKTISNVFFLPEKTYDIIRRNNLNIGELWANYLGGSWQMHFTNFVKNNELDIVCRVSELIKECFDSEDYKSMLCDLLIMEKQISTETDNVADYSNVLASYCELKLDFYEKHCVKTEEGLPLDVQGAKKIKDFIELENVDKVQALNSLKEVVDLRPDFTDGIKSFLHAYAQEQKQKSANPSDEMLQLRNQVLQQVYILRDNGMEQEALQIVQQLKAMFPEDGEIIEIEHRMKS